MSSSDTVGCAPVPSSPAELLQQRRNERSSGHGGCGSTSTSPHDIRRSIQLGDTGSCSTQQSRSSAKFDGLSSIQIMAQRRADRVSDTAGGVDAVVTQPHGSNSSKHAQLSQLLQDRRVHTARSPEGWRSPAEERLALTRSLEAELAAVNEKLVELKEQMSNCVRELSEFHEDHTCFVKNAGIDTQEIQRLVSQACTTRLPQRSDTGSQVELCELLEPCVVDNLPVRPAEWLTSPSSSSVQLGQTMPTAKPSIAEQVKAAEALPSFEANECVECTDVADAVDTAELTPPRSPQSQISPECVECSDVADTMDTAELIAPRSPKRASIGSHASSPESFGQRTSLMSQTQTYNSNPESMYQIGSYDSSRAEDCHSGREVRRARTTHQMPVTTGSTDIMSELFQTLSRVRYRSDRQKKVWSFMEDPDLVQGGRLYIRVSSMVIFISALLPLIQQTNPPPMDVHLVLVFDVVFDMLFAIEVVIRFLTCPNRISFCLSAYNWLDMADSMLALLVHNLTNLTLFQAQSPVLMFIICAVPILRLLKLLRRFDTFHLILKAFNLALEALPVLLYILLILVLVFASAIYIVEPRNNIDSMAQSLWLTIVTVGTIGYGDVTPESTEGSLVVSILVVVSALYMAIPIGIVGKAFSTVWDDRDRLLLMHRTRCRFLSSGYKAKDVPAMFFSFDMDSDGQLSLEEFLAMMSQLQVEISNTRLVQLFDSFDNDGNGTIDDHEFVHTLFPSAYAEIYGCPQSQQAFFNKGYIQDEQELTAPKELFPDASVPHM